MKISEQLKAARALISSPTTWMQGDFMGHRNGVMCYCSLGAISVVAAQHRGLGKYSILERRLEDVISVDRRIAVGHYNDTHTHAEVMLMWYKAIALAEAEELSADASSLRSDTGAV